ncbi:MAG TPA: PEGA domain-containing protein [Candidatus Saccharimonadales bacterium]|nr:PEGA domain-containing protein [Candidatus Saccharimonadales bacterium]
MEYLDPKKQKAHLIRLVIGYILVGTALIMTAVILLYQAYGFGIKNGEVIQNGLVFVSSRPRPADVYINGVLSEKTTNSRLLLPAGQYTFKMQREGYRTWQRAVPIEGGSVSRFDYPVLFPVKLTTAKVATYASAPSLWTQSPDRRWALVQNPAAYNVFDMYDLDSPKAEATQLSLPTTIFNSSTGVHGWELVKWSSNNRHVLLKHLTDDNGTKASEYILVDREDAAASLNLTNKLGVNPSQIELRDDKYDKYYLFDKTTATLKTATLERPTPEPFLDGVLAFKPHGENRVLYVTTTKTDAGKAAVRLRDGEKTYTVRQVPASDTYLVDLAQYSGDWYIVAGSAADNRAYVYKNPVDLLRKAGSDPIAPVHVLKVIAPNHVSFSDNARFIMAESGPQFAVYDAETERGYAYTQKMPLDVPQKHATWMDGHRMMYVSGGKVFVFEFDNANKETLNAMNPAYTPFFDPKYQTLYSLGAQDASQVLNATALLLPKDQ